MQLHRLLRAALLGGASLLALPAAHAADYPNKPITLIVPFPAGSGTDAVGRIFGAELSTILGQQIVVENKPGANATIAASYVARAKPDGYTLFVTTNTSHSAAPWLMKNIPYDPVKDFTPIARGGNLPFILVVNPKRPWKTVADLVADARQHPGRITYASGNSTGIVAGATLANRAR
ncbi:Bug family tripartite tricarboxylate transporter substrate binding protein, partial [Achromobacter xylosoxidans]